MSVNSGSRMDVTSEKKWIIFLGVNGPIGTACVKKIIKEDFNVIGTYSGNSKIDFDKFSELEHLSGNRIKLVKMNVDSSEDTRNFLTYLHENVKSIEGIVCNIGILTHSFSLFTTENELSRILNINFSKPLLLIVAILAKFIKKGVKSIVLISSTTADDGDGGRLMYSASKSAINAASRVLSRELGKTEIRVNIVSPGMIESPMLTSNTSKEEIENRVSRLSLRRLGLPHEIASVVHFLLSEDSSYLTGQNIRVDGGM